MMSLMLLVLLVHYGHGHGRLVRRRQLQDDEKIGFRGSTRYRVVLTCRLDRMPRLAGPTPKPSQLIQASLAVRSDVFHSMLPSVRISPRKHLSM